MALGDLGRFPFWSRQLAEALASPEPSCSNATCPFSLGWSSISPGFFFCDADHFFCQPNQYHKHQTDDGELSMAREYAGTDLAEIRESLREEGFTETWEESADGFDLWRPFDDEPQWNCVHAVVWKRKPQDGAGYWVEQY
jgi:hypothetical protein